MSTTETQRATKTHVAEAAKATAENDARIVAHVSQALEAAQEDLASIGGSLGAGGRDLGKDVQRLLRDARRDLKKMRKALQRDIERLQKALATDALKRGSAGRARPAADESSPSAGETRQ
jgi:ABC-type transporter Mla subunit MlaD